MCASLTMGIKECAKTKVSVRFEAAIQRTLTVAIIDRHMKRRLKGSVGDYLVVNDYYDFSSTGLVKYNRANAQNELGPSDITLQVLTKSNTFHVRSLWSGMNNYFYVYRNGTALRDPYDRQKSSENDGKIFDHKNFVLFCRFFLEF